MFITFEGIDGSGKTTQARLLAERLAATGRGQPLVVREPGGAALPERIRTLLLDEQLDVDPMAELLLFSAARAQLVAEKIRPALDEGRPVLCDRFYDSTTAYQGAGRALAAPGGKESSNAGGSNAWLERLHRRVTGGLVPERTFLLRLRPEEAERRRAADASRNAPDRMETGPSDFYQRVADAYDALAARHPERFRVLDATRAPRALHEAIWHEVAA